jgi:hypothetical protein
VVERAVAERAVHDAIEAILEWAGMEFRALASASRNDATSNVTPNE